VAISTGDAPGVDSRAAIFSIASTALWRFVPFEIAGAARAWRAMSEAIRNELFELSGADDKCRLCGLN